MSYLVIKNPKPDNESGNYARRDAMHGVSTLVS